MGDKTDRVGGKAKETAGKVTGDRELERSGRDDQQKGNLKAAGENLKDAVKKSV
jgi:uncharacterized protein YjbJ (UPF0337 family)